MRSSLGGNGPEDSRGVNTKVRRSIGIAFPRPAGVRSGRAAGILRGGVGVRRCNRDRGGLSLLPVLESSLCGREQADGVGSVHSVSEVERSATGCRFSEMGKAHLGRSGRPDRARHDGGTSAGIDQAIEKRVRKSRRGFHGDRHCLGEQEPAGQRLKDAEEYRNGLES